MFSSFHTIKLVFIRKLCLKQRKMPMHLGKGHAIPWRGLPYKKMGELVAPLRDLKNDVDTS